MKPYLRHHSGAQANVVCGGAFSAVAQAITKVYHDGDLDHDVTIRTTVKCPFAHLGNNKPLVRTFDVTRKGDVYSASEIMVQDGKVSHPVKAYFTPEDIHTISGKRLVMEEVSSTEEAVRITTECGYPTYWAFRGPRIFVFRERT